MGLEVASYISGLATAWPLSTDKIREGDDHFRLIKTVLQNTFPGMNAEVTATPAILNALPEDMDLILVELLKHLTFAGMITSFSGSVGSIPTGWALCNGSSGTPDLRGKFIIGAGGSYSVGDTGGAASVSSGATSLDGDTDDTILDLTQIPSHRHLLFINTTADGVVSSANSVYVASNSGGDQEYSLDGGSGDPDVGRSQAVGGGLGHHHSITGTSHQHTVATLPPYYALCWIMKLASYAAP